MTVPAVDNSLADAVGCSAESLVWPVDCIAAQHTVASNT